MIKRFQKLQAVMDDTSLPRTTLYKKIKQGEFPAPIKIGACSVWLEHEVQEWMEKQIEMSKKVVAEDEQ
ncbi:MAG: AlpA family phage regulatory protein [Hahellaceae bacterium]|nr:AlpA family phage regulatory protein [Hahellaceae bacterium]